MFWDSLLDVGKDYYGPWLCIGDFKMILSQFEKYGGRPYAYEGFPRMTPINILLALCY
jgi:hypothetical protein